MPERPAHHTNPDYKAAVDAVIEFAESVGYRHIIGLFAEELIDAALPDLKRMIESEEGRRYVYG